MPANDGRQCGLAGCNELAVALLEGRSVCRGHFISVCYTRLEGYAELQREHRLGEIAADSVRRFIHECVRQADEIEHATRHLDNLERARLLDIVLWATEVGRRLRRSPRKAASIPIRLTLEEPGRVWEEDTQTLLLSRHGALVECRHRAKPGDAIRMLRLDTAKQASARVAWIGPRESEQHEIAIEFLEGQNFWELDWDAAELTGDAFG